MKSRGNSLVGLLVAVVIVILAVLYFTTGGKFLGGKVAERPDGKGETLIGRSMYAAKDDACISNLKQVRMGVDIASDPVDGTKPASLQETKLGGQFYVCPVGNEPYDYDPATGKVHCPHKGHEKY